MKVLKIHGGKELEGKVKISGAKNSAVALLPATILCDDTVTLHNVPDISDVDALVDILNYLGAKVDNYEEESYRIDTKQMQNREIIEEMSNKLRASYYFMGALLGKYKKAVVSYPGGCSIGSRPIDLHLKGFESLGAKIEYEENNIIISAEELKGSNIYLDFASVGATINIMFAAVKAEGTTIIDNAAREPEIVNIAMFLNSMGAKITGAGTSTIRIKGVKNMHSSVHEVIPDRIEAGTYIMIGACACKSLVVENIIPEHLEALTQKLLEMGVDLKIEDESIYVSNKNKLKAVKIKTQVYPGFPTDMQQIMSSLMTTAEGRSVIEETIYENRFQNLYEIKKMGANVEINSNKGYIFGPTKLRGKTVNATDLRAGASLVLAALIAEGTTTINNADYILRGYEHITEKLTSLGAKIELTQI
ncbi:uDP-N-acetylglucosamine 1-carboxyvinyltransferase 1 [Clostridium sp. CAG:433]|nr:uDP-N-acetylglucosamine 1-carboxyvinyltransferase 1 [Clostridium sp. CAG:433]HCJ32300.1 UDP-N-acetylglucosamine 1-carboxyvinyltransferase [Bacillota bacterium]